ECESELTLRGGQGHRRHCILVGRADSCLCRSWLRDAMGGGDRASSLEGAVPRKVAIFGGPGFNEPAGDREDANALPKVAAAGHLARRKPIEGGDGNGRNGLRVEAGWTDTRGRLGPGWPACDGAPRIRYGLHPSHPQLMLTVPATGDI